MSARRRFVFFTNAGVPETGLSPTFATWLGSDGNPPVAGAPAISEVGGGVYTYAIPVALAIDTVAVIDGGAGLANADRYKLDTIVLADAGLGPDVVWAPLTQIRGFVTFESEGVTQYQLYVYLTDRDKKPLTGLTWADVDSIACQTLGEMSNRNIADISASSNLIEVDAGSVPGLYVIDIQSESLKAQDSVIIFLRLTADTQRAYAVPAWIGSLGKTTGGSGNEDILGQLMMIVAIVTSIFTGFNSATDWTSFNAQGQPTAGLMKFYQDSAAAAARDPGKLISTFGLTYTYDGQGRQSGQVKTLDADALVAIYAYLQSLGG